MASTCRHHFLQWSSLFDHHHHHHWLDFKVCLHLSGSRPLICLASLIASSVHLLCLMTPLILLGVLSFFSPIEMFHPSQVSKFYFIQHIQFFVHFVLFIIALSSPDAILLYCSSIHSHKALFFRSCLDYLIGLL